MQIFSQLPSHTLEVSQGTVAALPDERLRWLAEYWQSKCGTDETAGGTVPERSAIDPLDFPALLPNIMLIERVIEGGQDRYRFRLAGTDIVHYTGREVTGKFIDEMLPPDYHEYVRLMDRIVLARRRPLYSSSLYHDEGNFVNGITYRLLLPLRSSAGAEPDMVLACQFWQRREGSGYWNGDWRSVMPEIRVLDNA